MSDVTCPHKNWIIDGWTFDCEGGPIRWREPWKHRVIIPGKLICQECGYQPTPMSAVNLLEFTVGVTSVTWEPSNHFMLP